MNILNKTILAIVITFGILSCSKSKSTPNTNNLTTDTTSIDASKLTSSAWQGIGMYNLYYSLTTGNLVDGDGANIHSPNQYSMWWLDAYKAKFTFNANNTYTHVLWDGGGDTDCYTVFIPNSGTWQLADNNKTFLITCPSAPGGMLSCKVVSFRDNYMHVAYTDTGANRKDVFNLEFQR